MSLEQVIGDLAEHIDDAIAIIRKPQDGGAARLVWVNSHFSRILGFTAKEVVGEPALDAYGSTIAPETLADIRATVERDEDFRGEIECQRKDGTPFWVDASIRCAGVDADGFRLFVHVYRDIDALRSREAAADRALRERAEIDAEMEATRVRLGNAVNAIPDPFAVFDNDVRLLFFNDAYARCFSSDPAEIFAGIPFRELIDIGVRNGLMPEAEGCEDELYASSLSDWGDDTPSMDLVLPDGREQRVYRTLTPSGDKVVLRVDITEIQQAKHKLALYARQLEQAKTELEEQASVDLLTGIGNRDFIDRRIDALLSRIEGTDRQVAVLHLDLDRFKQINDTMGHGYGDMVLEQTAAILQDISPKGVELARIGGDEFAAALICTEEGEEAPRLAKAVMARLAKPLMIAGSECRVTASVGISTTAHCAATAQDLLMTSDIALYRAKLLGNGKPVTFNENLREEATARKRLADEILAGIEREEFVPVYQPQFDARTLRLSGVEVLMRWRHPERGLLTPDKFLETADDLKVLEPIDGQIFRAALAQCQALVEQGHDLPQVSFNLTARRLRDRAIISDARYAARFSFKVAFELLETAFVEDEADALRMQIDALREYGIGFEIDDFGSGRASILALMSVEPNALKIDRRLVKPLGRSQNAQRLVQAIMDIASALSIRVYAEGVETGLQAATLRRMGCGVLQGFVFARPVPVEALPDYLGEEALQDRLAILNAAEAEMPGRVA